MSKIYFLRTGIMRGIGEKGGENMFVIEYTNYFPNNESYSLDDHYFVEIEKAVEYLKNDGFEWEQYNTYKKGEVFGVRANIFRLVKFD